MNTFYYFRSTSTNGLGEGPMSDIANLTTADRYCGDGICDDGYETCLTCFLDCHSCGYKPCEGKPECNAHGTCVNGICACSDGWNGQACEANSAPPITVIVNGTSPVVDIGLNDTTQGAGVSFSILFDFLKEVSVSGDIVHTEDLTHLTFSVSHNKSHLTNGDTVDVYEYSKQLPNGAGLQINITLFIHAVTVPFANTTINVPENAVKYAMNISSWPFTSITNKLLVGIQSSAYSAISGTDCVTTHTTEDESANLRTLKIESNGVELYGKFEEIAIIDTSVKNVQFSYDQTSQHTLVTIPHFWAFADIDPDFQVLINPLGPSTPGCGAKSHKKNVTGKIVGAVVGAIVGVAIIVAISILLYKRHRKKRWMQRIGSESHGNKMSPLYNSQQ
eukprot:Phypoly_transcript_04340.p1 GENE.Phypoly_transcript_04340~~Phypoly_transcript_04340.p1  ORF type:complete len:390 (+),score=42.78 Phypoly_transcript_04340:1014-2183(+)